MMHYTTELLDDNTLLFRFTVPAEEYTAALDEAWRTHKDRYPVPGMRDGKASRTMIERHHGKDVFEKPALDQLVTSAYRKAASEYPEEIYYTPTVRVEQHEEGKALCFTARVQIRPEVRLGDYRAVQLQPEDLRRAAQKAQEVPGEQQSETRAYLLRSALVDRIAAGSRVEVPETMIHERALSMARSLEQRLEQDQSSMEEYYKACHTDREHLLADFAQAAEDQLRARLTLLAIARAEGLGATEAEYDAEVARLSGMYLMPEEKLRPLLAHREGIKIRQDIAISKAADWVAAQVRQQTAATSSNRKNNGPCSNPCTGRFVSIPRAESTPLPAAKPG